MGVEKASSTDLGITIKSPIKSCKTSPNRESRRNKYSSSEKFCLWVETN